MCIRDRIKDKLKKKDHCIIAVSEGIRDQYGMCVSLDSGIQKDAFGHLSNNGCSNYLKKLIGDHLGCKVRAIQLSTCLLYTSTQYLNNSRKV